MTVFFCHLFLLANTLPSHPPPEFHLKCPLCQPRLEQLAWAPLGVRGRVYVAKEGINAQMAVPCTSAERFERAVEAVEKLAGV